ncbi:ABC transporter substrate-binding protein [Piscinibacter sp.]|uniref:ABC transporter substrate-binding protein n=1 Tax=Piscinibacter sp. TaxID=1903157 RepID=UPI002B6FFBBB|nr:ABC transporter substrate-binding protein [Albitalea sp.]HUG25584.1 ABC transporter substrate-binding protein [Albitalea sp.]
MKRREFVAAAAAFSLVGQVRGAEPGVSDGEVVFGQTGILSGPLGQQIKTMLAGAALAFDANAAAGGVHGRRVRIASLDDELRPDKAVANYQELLTQQRVFGFFGCVGSATTAAAANVLQQSGAPLVGGYAVADSARDKVKGAGYYLRATSGREAEVLVQHLTTIGVTRIGVAVLDNPGGQEARALISGALEKHGLQPVSVAAVKGDASNAAQAAGTLAAGQPQAVLMYLGGVLPGELMKASWAIGTHPMFYGMSIVAGEVTAKVAGAKARGLAISQVVPYPWGELDPVVRAYRSSAQANKVPIGYYSFEGYLNARVLLEALTRCGRDLTRTRLHTTMRSLKLRLAGMDLDFTAGGHTGSRFVELVQVSVDGKFIR